MNFYTILMLNFNSTHYKLTLNLNQIALKKKLFFR